MTLVNLRAQLQIVSGYVDPSIKPTSVEGCDYVWNNFSTTTTTTLPPDTTDNPQTTDSKQLSFYYYSLFGFLITLAVSNIVNVFTRHDGLKVRPIDSRLLAPMVRNVFRHYTKDEVGLKEVAEMKSVVHTFKEVNESVDTPLQEDVLDAKTSN